MGFLSKNQKWNNEKEVVLAVVQQKGYALQYASDELNNNKEVIKFWMFDSAYETFIKYAKEHQSNPFIPKIIKGINELKFKNHTIKYIRTEKLKELHNSTIIFGVEFKKLINAIDKHIEKKGISKIFLTDL